MYLTYRLAQLPDLEVCYPFVQARLGYKKETCKELMAFSRELFKSGSCITLVIEDRERPKGSRQIAFGETFFAHDWFIQEAKKSQPPFLPLRILEKWKKGVWPFLTPEETLSTHSENGLNIVTLHWGVDPSYSHGDYLKIIEFFSQSYQKLLTEHRLKEFIEEVYGEFERDRFISFGLMVYRDFKELPDVKRSHQAIGKGWPYLMGVVLPKVKEQRKNMGSVAGKQALLGPPRFNFQASDQEVLKMAMQNQTDEEIAKGLKLSVIAIKKRWQSIYEKVQAIDQDLLSESAASDGKSKQKRRHLLALLKDHPEEFWPNSRHSPQKNKKKI